MQLTTETRNFGSEMLVITEALTYLEMARMGVG